MSLRRWEAQLFDERKESLEDDRMPDAVAVIRPRDPGEVAAALM